MDRAGPLLLQACLPAVVGFGLTLLLLRGGGLAVLAAIGATAAVQGGLLIGEFAPPASRKLDHVQRARAGLKLMIPFGATAVVATLILIYIGLGGQGDVPPPNTFYIGPALVVLAMLGSSVLLSPALVLDPEPGRAFERALTSVWRPIVAIALAVLCVAALAGAVWLGPDQLLSRGVVGDTDIAIVRAVSVWIAIAALAIPFWSTATRLYVAPAVG